MCSLQRRANATVVATDARPWRGRIALVAPSPTNVEKLAEMVANTAFGVARTTNNEHLLATVRGRLIVAPLPQLHETPAEQTKTKPLKAKSRSKMRAIICICTSRTLVSQPSASADKSR